MRHYNPEHCKEGVGSLEELQSNVEALKTFLTGYIEITEAIRIAKGE